MKKKLVLNVLTLSAFMTSFVVSCTQIGTAAGNLNNYAESLMKETEFMSKILLLNRSENLNVGTSSELQFLYLLPDSKYNNQLGKKRDEITETNGNFQKNYISIPSSINSTAPTALLSSFWGNNEDTNIYTRSDMYNREFDMNSSSIFDYSMDTGPMKTYLSSNSLINKKNDTDSIFNNGSTLDDYFAYNTSRYYSVSNGSIKNFNKKKMKEFQFDSDPGLTFYDTLDDGTKETYTVGSNEVNSANLYNFFKQVVGLNEISKSVPLVTNKNNINNLYLFLNNMFALDSTSNKNTFLNLSGTIFSKLYDGQNTSILTNGQGIKSLIFDQMFDDKTKSYYNSDFVNKRNNLVSRKSGFLNMNVDNRLDLWFTAFFNDRSNKKAWINGRDTEASIKDFDKGYNTLNSKKDNGGSENDTLNNILFDLDNDYIDYFNWIDSQPNSDEILNDLNEDFYQKINASLPLIGAIGESWADMIGQIAQKVKTKENPNGTLTAKSFIMGLLNIFMMCNSNNASLQAVKDSTGISSIGDISNLDLNVQANKTKVYQALGYQNGYIVSGSILDILYNTFNNPDDAGYALMHSVFLDDDSAIKAVLSNDYDSIMNTEINALFDEPTMGIDVNWSFSNPVYDDKNKTVTYDVNYDGPGDTAFDYDLHLSPLVSKEEQKNIKSHTLHSENNDGIWDYVLQKLDSNPDKYNMQWFLGYDGGASNEYAKVKNTYRITFKNTSAIAEKQTWALYDLKWYHNNQQYFGIFE